VSSPPVLKKQRDTAFVVEQAKSHYDACIEQDLMQANFHAREGKRVTLEGGRTVTEFINCSYFGFDTLPTVIAAAQKVVAEYGVHFCCARSRLTIDPNRELEAGLSRLFGGRAITFPSVTSAHMSALPLVASGVLLPERMRRPVRFVFDRSAHASMQYLKPVLAQEARVETIDHNAMDQLAAHAVEAKAAGETVVHVADGVYSMGGVCPLDALLALSQEHGLFLYLDDAHGTSIFGERGEGYVLAKLGGALPDHVIVAYSLAKGFGTNGGGIVVSTAGQERLIRSFGQTYAFSGPLDFAIVGAALEVLKLHEDGTVRGLQHQLRETVGWFDAHLPPPDDSFSPIRMVEVGEADRAIALGRFLLEQGHFVSVAFFPVVPRGRAQLRVCLTQQHTKEQIDSLCAAIKQGLATLK
jgi:8-amino-7-oxononanoate synthase